MAFCLLQLVDDSLNAVVIQPRLSVATVQFTQRRRQSAFEQYFVEVLPLGEFGNVRVSLNPLPAHCPELLAEGALYQVIFPLDFAHGTDALVGAARRRDANLS